MNPLRKGTKLYSILTHTCPQCQESNLFTSGPYSRKFSEMPSHCPNCGQPFELEPSFYSGAMYVSYALQVALLTTVFVALRVLFDPKVTVYIYSSIGTALGLFPVTLRLSRSIYINFFVSYDPGKSRQKTAAEVTLVTDHV